MHLKVLLLLLSSLVPSNSSFGVIPEATASLVFIVAPPAASSPAVAAAAPSAGTDPAVAKVQQELADWSGKLAALSDEDIWADKGFLPITVTNPVLSFPTSLSSILLRPSHVGRIPGVGEVRPRSMGH